MNYLYDFGISQDDPHVETKALSLDNNSLLCIASGGEVPLSVLTRYNTQIKALDISENQLKLCRLKLASVLGLEPKEASTFLGFKRDLENKRDLYFSKVATLLSPEDLDFWNRYKHQISNGPVSQSRFEKYLRVFCKMVLGIMGRKRFIQLFEMDSIESQRIHFDKYLDKRLIFWIFRIAFSPMLYKNRGLDQRALIHQKGNDMARLFYGRFRDFCSATPARLNYYLQFYFLGEVLFDEALPDYLQDQGIENIRKRKMNIMFEAKSIQEEISTSEELNFGNYTLSNISDWITVEEMNDLLYSISKKTIVETDLLIRYIHKNPVNEKMQYSRLDFDESAGISVRDVDRFPFYTILKAKRKMQK